MYHKLQTFTLSILEAESLLLLDLLEPHRARCTGTSGEQRDAFICIVPKLSHIKTIARVLTALKQTAEQS